MRLDSFSLANGKILAHSTRKYYYFVFSLSSFFICWWIFGGCVVSRCFRLRSLPFPPVRYGNLQYNPIFRYHFEIDEMRAHSSSSITCERFWGSTRTTRKTVTEYTRLFDTLPFLLAILSPHQFRLESTGNLSWPRYGRKSKMGDCSQMALRA